MRKRFAIATLFFPACTLLYADVTVRQSIDFKMNMPIPMAQAQQLPFHEVLMRIKGDRAYTQTGMMNTITDASTGEITVLDPKTSRYATGTMAEYIAGIQQSVSANAMPEQAKALLSQIKVDMDSHDTGRTDRVQGVDAAEREILMTLSIPIPIPGQENGLRVQVKVQVWKASTEAAARVPWLREMTAFYSRSTDLSNPLAMMRQMFAAFPGFGDSIDKLVEEMSKGGGVTLRMRMTVQMPGLASLLARRQATGADVPPALAANAPLVEMTTEIKDVSTDPIADSMVRIPEGYQKVAMEDLVKSVLPAAPAAPKQ